MVVRFLNVILFLSTFLTCSALKSLDIVFNPLKELDKAMPKSERLIPSLPSGLKKSGTENIIKEIKIPNPKAPKVDDLEPFNRANNLISTMGNDFIDTITSSYTAFSEMPKTIYYQLGTIKKEITDDDSIEGMDIVNVLSYQNDRLPIIQGTGLPIEEPLMMKEYKRKHFDVGFDGGKINLKSKSNDGMKNLVEDVSKTIVSTGLDSVMPINNTVPFKKDLKVIDDMFNALIPTTPVPNMNDMAQNSPIGFDKKGAMPEDLIDAIGEAL